MNVQRGKRAKANDVIRLPARRQRSFLLSLEPFLKSDYQVSWNFIQSNIQIGTFFICLEGGLYLLMNLSTKYLHYQWAVSGSYSKPIILKQIWIKYWLMWQKGIWLVGRGLSWTTTKSLLCNAYYAWFGKPGSEMETCKSLEYIWLWNRTRFFTFFLFYFQNYVGRSHSWFLI